MNTTKIYPNKSLHTASRIIDRQAVVVIPREGQVNILNQVGSRIWELADGKKSLDEIAVIISDEFEVEPEAAYLDTGEFVRELLEKEMLVI
jgi:Coenzyme PQQ synthesis protein D (PqqD)